MTSYRRFLSLASPRTPDGADHFRKGWEGSCTCKCGCHEARRVSMVRGWRGVTTETALRLANRSLILFPDAARDSENPSRRSRAVLPLPAALDVDLTVRRFVQKGIEHGRRTTRTQTIEGHQLTRQPASTTYIKDRREQGLDGRRVGNWRLRRNSDRWRKYFDQRKRLATLAGEPFMVQCTT